jgi:hypothetical protein
MKEGKLGSLRVVQQTQMRWELVRNTSILHSCPGLRKEGKGAHSNDQNKCWHIELFTTEHFLTNSPLSNKQAEKALRVRNHPKHDTVTSGMKSKISAMHSSEGCRAYLNTDCSYRVLEGGGVLWWR